MNIRQATINDIPGIQVVRHAVLENRLSDPSLVPDKDVEDYIINRGRGWVCETGGIIVGFSIVSVTDKNVWALFVDPGFDKKGIGKKLHAIMMNWYFEQTDETIWLSTAQGTRAENFYRLQGWTQCDFTKTGEVKFEMTALQWLQKKPAT